MTARRFKFPALITGICEEIVPQTRITKAKSHTLIILPVSVYEIVKNNSILFACLTELLYLEKTHCVLCPDTLLER